MGYYMEQTRSKFFISKENQEPALHALKLLGNKTELMSGGSYQGGRKVENWFSWVDMEDFLSSASLSEAMSTWSWEAELNDDGDIFDIQFDGEKIGQEELMFEAIAPYVEDGSYIQMLGEDGSQWRWIFKDGKVKEVFAKISFEE